MEPSRYSLRSRTARPLAGLNPVSHGSTLPGRPFSASGTRSSRFFDSIPVSAALPGAGNVSAPAPTPAPACSIPGLSTPSPELYKPLSAPSRRSSSSSSSRAASARSAAISSLKKQLAEVELGMKECTTILASAARVCPDLPSPVRALEFPPGHGLGSSSYRTVSLKEAQIEAICKLTPGEVDKQLNWHFEAESQLDALNLRLVSA